MPGTGHRRPCERHKDPENTKAPCRCPMTAIPQTLPLPTKTVFTCLDDTLRWTEASAPSARHPSRESTALWCRGRVSRPSIPIAVPKQYTAPLSRSQAVIRVRIITFVPASLLPVPPIGGCGGGLTVTAASDYNLLRVLPIMTVAALPSRTRHAAPDVPAACIWKG